VDNRLGARCVVALVALSASGCARRAAAEHVTLRGSDTMVLLAQQWAARFSETRDDGVAVEVSGGGSGTGFAALENGTADIASASRAIRPEERARIERARHTRVEEHRVAIDAIAIYVHPSNAVEALTLDELRAAYTGRLRAWRASGRPIVLYSRENSSGTYAYFKEHVPAEADFAPEVQPLPGTAAVLYAVSRDPDGLGYGGIARSRGVRVVPLRVGAEVISPTREAARAGAYPLARPLFLYSLAGARPSVTRFIDWVRGPAGQALVEEAGFFPIDEPLARGR
jgi:phosphate transport system substrate-binding protein